jgi:hypothetical protein
MSILDLYEFSNLGGIFLFKRKKFLSIKVYIRVTGSGPIVQTAGSHMIPYDHITVMVDFVNLLFHKPVKHKSTPQAESVGVADRS